MATAILPRFYNNRKFISLHDERFNHQKIFNNNMEHYAFIMNIICDQQNSLYYTRDRTCGKSSTPVTSVKHCVPPAIENNDKPLNKTFSHLVAKNAFTTKFCSNFDG